ncbi:hypothetical protein P5673_002626 [Acropora cervicornis]|uniref:Uncharacterized protein n=1 Tax=Acropora cervicornis TaxID=6130 RepID=A0AAD9VFC2_ACRCE|nr:hypothetical protein P5673_002626 [Acropora cervicornis]
MWNSLLCRSPVSGGQVNDFISSSSESKKLLGIRVFSITSLSDIFRLTKTFTLKGRAFLHGRESRCRVYVLVRQRADYWLFVNATPNLAWKLAGHRSFHVENSKT